MGRITKTEEEDNCILGPNDRRGRYLEFSTTTAAVVPEWSATDDKKFEVALAKHIDDDSGRRLCSKVASMLIGKSAEQVQKRYKELEDMVRRIESGEVALPSYEDDEEEEDLDLDGTGDKASARALAKTASENERRKGIPWSEEEHRLFLMGLAKFGKGDWRSISRTYVISRTPTQVASHAQKYFIRLNSLNKKDKRRSSIHDITSITNKNAQEALAMHQMPQYTHQAVYSSQGVLMGHTGGPPQGYMHQGTHAPQYMQR
mmetsp:Transcript_5507/g.7444  ORF Transcript_5507/g.7444 Transcript_5507/m.7444 type:complete len:260 (-) Transcript_5507:184-963(-)|eukprot:CAMPEP_0196586590 /NCGR_PEP_ID=MMETSP1081-20130531/54882_1 /TAXON_ID=36882 /ORGANISM="Pyramimonas amylifera, Strain CCMP720" /LENGTH=259 /DNA_ID=CAMNT_0041908523 /DNA_START=201 /DNA_END=980 /DNA_ORIENTATION=+